MCVIFPQPLSLLHPRFPTVTGRSPGSSLLSTTRAGLSFLAWCLPTIPTDSALFVALPHLIYFPFLTIFFSMSPEASGSCFPGHRLLPEEYGRLSLFPPPLCNYRDSQELVARRDGAESFPLPPSHVFSRLKTAASENSGFLFSPTSRIAAELATVAFPLSPSRGATFSSPLFLCPSSSYNAGVRSVNLSF